ncbi:MAG: 4Fe-4S binding protein [Candidatus Omnitrophica bacterium]|nr:4Fe-4S binding protein [Candidatus Omnitrophota bacterium]MBU4346602.1 4Fe-4S binding protein [Candidatus Omnitrophota bacterium]MBU4472940.1 4Fe-4S binding protein [Candidatus Omnitrophota bacterium]MCG2706358.1 4Fe-4S binding protein [Candidatus Omnitrophota bacterium]
MKYPKLRELKEAIKALIKGPYTSRFPYEPHQPYERFRGKPQFHEEDCVGCGACFQVCPAKAIEMQDIRDKRILTVHWDMCIFCGQCQVNCLTEKGIVLSQEFDLATTEKREDLNQKIEKKLILCQGCGEVIAPADQILWVAKRLGPLCYANASLMLFYLRSLDLTLSAAVEKEKFPPKEELEFMRSDRIKILCPRCRRQAVLKS